MLTKVVKLKAFIGSFQIKKPKSKILVYKILSWILWIRKIRNFIMVIKNF